MEREHVAVVVLLLVLVVALVPLVLGQTRDEEIGLPDGDAGAPSAGRLVEDEELSGSCLELAAPRRTEGSCVVTIAATDVPAWDVAVIGRFVPRELRRVDLAWSGDCVADVSLRFDEVDIEAVLGPEDPDDPDDEVVETASFSVGADGATLAISTGFDPACRVLLPDLDA